MPTLLENVKSFPKSPGVYLMKSAQGEILYIGKATNLKSRVLSYFGKESGERYQIRFLMSKVRDIDTMMTQNDKEALLLENTLIKKHRPRYNIDLKDDKNYVRLRLSTRDAAPRLYITRKIKKNDGLYFGPYTSAIACREVVDFIQKHFRLRNCSDREYANRTRPCLQYQIKRCDAPCVQLISLTEYQKKVQQVRLFLEGKNEELKKQIYGEMQKSAELEQFENAAYCRDLLQNIEVTLKKQKVVSHDGENQDFIGLQREKLQTAIVVMIVRDGALQEQKEFFFESCELDEDLCKNFMAQYYQEALVIPQEIFLPLDLEDSISWEEILSERRGSKVKILYPQRGHKSHFVTMAQTNAAQALQRRIENQHQDLQLLKKLQQRIQLKNLPWRIECFDISHFQGSQTVASMVTFIEGKADKNLYRRFHIRSVTDIDDFASIYEVVSRRLKNYFKDREDENSPWKLPELIVIDGGKGQLNAAVQAFKDCGVEGVDLISLAKSRIEKDPKNWKDEANEGEASPDDIAEESKILPLNLGEKTRSPERVFIPGRKNPVIFNASDAALHLLMRARDEAHRFGIEFHRKLRQGRVIHSSLEQIPGIGPKRLKLLLENFPSVFEVAEADPQKIREILKIPEAQAFEIQSALRQEIQRSFMGG